MIAMFGIVSYSAVINFLAGSINILEFNFSITIAIFCALLGAPYAAAFIVFTSLRINVQKTFVAMAENSPQLRSRTSA
jgi:hypothetical protein